MEIIEVKSNGEFKRFLGLSKTIYGRTDKHYVQPLNLHMKMMIGKLDRPEKHLLLAVKDGKAVARVGFKVHKAGKDTSLNFGFFECLEGHQDAVQELFKWGRNKYPELSIKGPYHFRMEDPYIGTLIEGYDKEPYFLMSYNPRYYNDYLEQAGLSKAMDLFTYEVRSDNPLDVLDSSVEKAKSNGITTRTLDKKHLEKEARIISGIFNDALSRNWGFEEFEQEQVDEMVMLLRTFIDPRVVLFAMKDGKEVGCLIVIPDYNPIIKGTNGRLTPGLIWRFLRRKKLINKARGYALGVLKDYHGMGVGSLLTKSMFERGHQAGYYDAEISWVLANNGPMNELSKAMGGKHDKVYRVYEMPPAHA